MEKIIKPQQLNIDPISPAARKEWVHWLKVFENFIEIAKVPDEDVLKVLISFLSYSVYEFIEECSSYEDAIKVLNETYSKPLNVIFARHKLATRRQQPNESIQQYVQSLKSLSKDCEFKSVTAEQNCRDCIRDAFINGLLSAEIRQRLLENNSLELQDAVNKSLALETAQKNAQFYNTSVSSYTPNDVVNAMPKENMEKQSTRSSEQSTTAAVGLHSKCFFCGNVRHPRSICPAKDVICHQCGIKKDISQRYVNRNPIIADLEQKKMYPPFLNSQI